MPTLISEIDTFMAAHGLSERQFGELSLKDKNFVNQLREGRDLRLSTVAKLRHFMMTYRAEAA